MSKIIKFETLPNSDGCKMTIHTDISSIILIFQDVDKKENSIFDDSHYFCRVDRDITEEISKDTYDRLVMEIGYENAKQNRLS